MQRTEDRTYETLFQFLFVNALCSRHGEKTGSIPFPGGPLRRGWRGVSEPPHSLDSSQGPSPARSFIGGWWLLITHQLSPNSRAPPQLRWTARLSTEASPTRGFIGPGFGRRARKEVAPGLTSRRHPGRLMRRKKVCVCVFLCNGCLRWSRHPPEGAQTTAFRTHIYIYI